MIKQITSALKITPFAFIVAIVFLFGLSYTYAAFTDNTKTPPTYNAPAPLNAGSEFQNKTGNLGTNGLVTKILSVNGAIDFNGVTRTTWPSGGSGLTGATGPRGLTGATGATGPRGLTGLTGPSGATTVGYTGTYFDTCVYSTSQYGYGRAWYNVYRNGLLVSRIIEGAYSRCFTSPGGP